MKCHRVTCYVEGEAITEPVVPACCIPLLRWLVRLLGGRIYVGPQEVK